MRSRSRPMAGAPVSAPAGRRAPTFASQYAAAAFARPRRQWVNVLLVFGGATVNDVLAAGPSMRARLGCSTRWPAWTRSSSTPPSRPFPLSSCATLPAVPTALSRPLEVLPDGPKGLHADGHPPGPLRGHALSLSARARPARFHPRSPHPTRALTFFALIPTLALTATLTLTTRCASSWSSFLALTLCSDLDVVWLRPAPIPRQVPVPGCCHCRRACTDVTRRHPTMTKRGGVFMASSTQALSCAIYAALALCDGGFAGCKRSGERPARERRAVSCAPTHPSPSSLLPNLAQEMREATAVRWIPPVVVQRPDILQRGRAPRAADGTGWRSGGRRRDARLGCGSCVRRALASDGCGLERCTT